jgi:hypothetical protein
VFFMLPMLKKRRSRLNFTSIFGSAFLLFIHYLFIKANI